jgi:glycosyltransferase involved in cell wall biosynthesis
MDYVARTGFGTVSKNIVKELKKHYGQDLLLDIIAINYFGEPYHEDDNTFVISARLNDVNDDPFGRFFFLKILKETDAYDGIFICQDLGTITSFMEVLEHIKQDKKDNNKKVFKSIFYTPVDCPQLIYPLVKGLDFFDVLVTYTEFGRKLINGLRPELKVKVIPHGNSSKDFFPMVEEDIKKFRQEYFGENADKFIITNINRNQPRKDLPNTIFAFMEAKEIWKENLPKPFLYLHTHPKDPMGWDIRALMMQTDLVEDVDYKLLPKEYEEQGTETALVNKIYNASDVYLTTTLGEGWGLGFSEAAACKVPIIAPYTTSFIEMSNYGKNAYMLESLYPFVNETDNVIRQQTDIYEIAETIKYVAEAKFGLLEELNAKAILQEKIENNYKWSKKIEWSEVCKSWIEYFKIF